MFNLPFPTDSLYKFSFMFGLALIVFSFYYQDNHLNKFDKKQLVYKRDSIFAKWYTIIEQPAVLKPGNKLIINRPEISDVQQASNELMPLSLDLINHAKDLNIRFTEKYPGIDPTLNQIFERLNLNKDPLYKFLNYENYNRTDKAGMDSLEHYLTAVNSILLPIAQRIAVETQFINEQIADYSRTLWFLRIIGALLFFPSIFLWYFKIQKPQDKLLQMQLIAAQSKITPSGRRHVEPRILPRSQPKRRI